MLQEKHFFKVILWTVLYVLHMLYHLVFKMILRCGYCYPHFVQKSQNLTSEIFSVKKMVNDETQN